MNDYGKQFETAVKAIRADERQRTVQECHAALERILHEGLQEVEAVPSVATIAPSRRKRTRRGSGITATENEIAAVREVLSGGQALTPKQIHGITKVGSRKAFAACQALAKDGSVKKVGKAYQATSVSNGAVSEQPAQA